MELANKLRKQAEHCSSRTRLVIAHSHGGNVAMRALHHLRDEKEPILLVTLATPFIQLFLQYPESPASKTYKRLAILVAGVVVALSAFGLVVQFGTPGGERSVLLGALYVLLAFFGLFGTPWVLLGGGWWSSQERSQRVARLFRACMTPPGKLAPHRFLILRGIEDEAGLTLAVGAFGARLSYVLAALGSRLLGSLGTIGVGAAIAVGTDLYVQGTPGTLTRLALVFLAFPLVLVASGSLLCVVCRSVHGRELVAGGLLCEVGSTAVPDNVASELMVATLPVQMERGLSVRHSLYDNLFCGQAIEDWLRMTLSGSTTDRDTLAFLVDFLYESPEEGLYGFITRTNRVLEEIDKERAEAADRKRGTFGTDEEWLWELEESERIHKEFTAWLADERNPVPLDSSIPSSSAHSSTSPGARRDPPPARADTPR